MISVEEAKNIVAKQVADWGTCKIPLTRAMGEILAEEVRADRDFPPYDRVTMDGIALSFDAFGSGRREYIVQETQLAGVPPVSLKSQDHAIEIMTGAVLSEGCDLVIRYEDLEFFDKSGEKWVRINEVSVERWKNVHRQASDQPKDALLIPQGKRITAAEIAIMATVGCSEVQVKRKPKVAIISTGDELVDVGQTPLPHQIRKSNSQVIAASLEKLGVPYELFHLLDNKEELLIRLIEIEKNHDILLLSGGVSKGKADFLPEVLTGLGIQKLFHRVSQRPGKPFWFGTKGKETHVFAFPGNPISTYMCYRIYFIPWLLENLGKRSLNQNATMMEEFSFNPELGYFLQVRSEMNVDGTVSVYPQPGNGSGDLANLAKSDAFLYLPAGEGSFRPGASYDYFPFDISSLA